MAISYTGSPYLSSSLLTTATPTNDGVLGGTYSSTQGLVINATTGVVNLIASDPGTYTVTYHVNSTNTTTTIVLDHSFTDINDLYAQTLLLDKQYVDACIADIKAEVFSRITNSDTPYFQYDSEPHLGALEPIQQYRVRDQVIVQLRNMGIRVSVSPLYVSAIIFPSYPVETSFIMNISWFIRDAQEYMKTYV
jgi:hypothetical protein